MFGIVAASEVATEVTDDKSFLEGLIGVDIPDYVLWIVLGIILVIIIIMIVRGYVTEVKRIDKLRAKGTSSKATTSSSSSGGKTGSDKGGKKKKKKK